MTMTEQVYAELAQTSRGWRRHSRWVLSLTSLFALWDEESFRSRACPGPNHILGAPIRIDNKAEGIHLEWYRPAPPKRRG